MIDDSIQKNVEITLSKDKNLNTSESNELNSKDIEKPLNTNYNSQNLFTKLSLKTLFFDSIKILIFF